MNRRPWKELERIARRVVAEALTELPPEIAKKASDVPCLFQDWNEDDPSLLGLYSDFIAGEVSESNGPIILYLASIEEFCREEKAEFEDEVRVTFLHELGHHFGWGEGELEERGLG